MDCKVAAELLPFYLNGSLSPAEHEAFDHHLDECQNCAEERDETFAAAQIFSAHLPAATIHDYASKGSAANWQTASIEDHLADCQLCQDEVLLVQESYRHLSQEKRWRPGVQWLGLAALLIVCLGLGWLWKGASEQNALPQSDFEIVNLFPAEKTLRSAGETRTIPARKGIALNLHSQLPTAQHTYRLVILNSLDELKWSTPINRATNGTFTLFLPAAFLQNEQLTLHLYIEGTHEPAEHYHLRPQKE